MPAGEPLLGCSRGDRQLLGHDLKNGDASSGHARDCSPTPGRHAPGDRRSGLAYMNRGVGSSREFMVVVAAAGAGWLRCAHAYIGARGAAQDVIGAISAAAHYLPGRPFGRQRGPGARRARLDIRSGGLAAIGEVGHAA